MTDRLTDQLTYMKGLKKVKLPVAISNDVVNSGKLK